MTALHHWEPGAGPWVAYVQEPEAEQRYRRSKSYIWRVNSPWRTSTTDPKDAIRFNTKAEALSTVRTLWPRRRGQVTGAERL